MWGCHSHCADLKISLLRIENLLKQDVFASVTNWQSLAEDLNQWVYAGDIFNIEDGAFSNADGATNAGAALEGVFSHVLLVDKSKVSGDGFDVNAIAVNGVGSQDVSEPASALGLVMLGAVSGSFLLKRQV